MSPTNLKANFCTFLSILYKTAGKLVVFWRFVGWWAICINISPDHSQISCFSCSFLIKFSKTWEHLQSDIIYSPTSGASTRRPRRPFPYGPANNQWHSLMNLGKGDVNGNKINEISLSDERLKLALREFKDYFILHFLQYLSKYWTLVNGTYAYSEEAYALPC